MDQLNNYLYISAILYSLGVAFSRFGGMNMDGHIFSLFVIVLAAAEAAVALAIVINIYNNLHTINVDDAAMMKE